MELGYLTPLIAYLLGSLPSAVIVSRRTAGVDIRELGDGNMGARNTTRTLGLRAGIMVAALDVGKGVLAVLLPNLLGLSLAWQLASAFGVVLGHDFPLFAGFKGGQGLGSTLGALAVMAPKETAIGMVVYGSLFLITRNSDLSAGVGVGLMVLLMWLFGEPLLLVFGSIALILIVPAKTLLDRPRRLRIKGA